MDADQSARRIAQVTFKIEDPDFYEFEAHVFFDDAFELNDNDKWVPNQFVKTLVAVINEAARCEWCQISCSPRNVRQFLELQRSAVLVEPGCLSCRSSVMESAYVMDPPNKVITPYGGRLLWKLPGGNSLIVHLKDKQKIRHRKRWSQARPQSPVLRQNASLGRLIESRLNTAVRANQSSVDTNTRL